MISAAGCSRGCDATSSAFAKPEYETPTTISFETFTPWASIRAGSRATAAS